ncbi:MAG: TetR/AcrR family transcriptional regulator [Burkholderiales bacterium]|nr:TetR/AcrR family transcriptional regulator [Burkholderiales bacterium]
MTNQFCGILAAVMVTKPARPRPPRRRAAPRAAVALSVRDRILLAAVELVQTEGVRSLTQARVAAEAGVRQSHLTYYFPARKDLIKEVAMRLHAGILEAMSESAPTTGSGTRSLKRAREFFAERISDPLFARLSMALMVAADEDPSMRRWLAESDTRLHDQLRETLARLGIDRSPDDVALLHASFVGASILSAQAGTKSAAARAAHLARFAFDRLVSGATASDGSRPTGAKRPPAPRRRRARRAAGAE